MEEGFLESSEVEDSNFILDRLCGLENLIPQELLEQVLLECGLHLQKACSGGRSGSPPAPESRSSVGHPRHAGSLL